MRIARVTIENYRVHRSTAVDLDSMTAFIGKNGAGKSSILYALDYFYDVSAVLTPDDVFAGDDAEVAISVTYTNLSDSELEEFGLYVRDGQLQVIKRAASGQPGRYYGIVPQLPDFTDVRAISGAREQTAAYNEIRTSGRYEGLPATRSQTDTLTAMDEFERNPDNAALLEPSEKQEQFFGDRRAGAGRLDNYTAFVLVPAVREATDETTKKGAIQVLVDRLVTSALATREDIAAFREEFEMRFRETYSPENLREIEGVSDSVNELLARYAPGIALRLSWREPIPPPFGLPTYDTRMGDDGYDTPIALQGHGMQRALILSLLQLLAQAPVQVSDGEDPRPVPDLIIAIEEPELYLHPAQCRYLARLLGELSSVVDRPTTQVLYATHSAYFATMDRFEQIRAVRRYPRAEGEVPCCNVQRLGFNELQGEIARVAAIDPAGITRDSFVARCASVMDIIANEGLFASAVVVVEGYGDLGCLRAIERQLGLAWDERGIVVVPARSKNNIDRPVHVFRGLGIPCYFMFDGDISKRATDGEADAVRSNRLLLRLANATEKDFPDTTVEASWAVLTDKLEVELRRPFEESADWDGVAQELRDDLGFASVSHLLKNPDGVAAVVKRGYALGRSFPVLEEVARRVSELVEPL